MIIKYKAKFNFVKLIYDLWFIIFNFIFIIFALWYQFINYVFNLHKIHRLILKMIIMQKINLQRKNPFWISMYYHELMKLLLYLIKKAYN